MACFLVASFAHELLKLPHRQHASCEASALASCDALRRLDGTKAAGWSAWPHVGSTLGPLLSTYS